MSDAFYWLTVPWRCEWCGRLRRRRQFKTVIPAGFVDIEWHDAMVVEGRFCADCRGWLA